LQNTQAVENHEKSKKIQGESSAEDRINSTNKAEKTMQLNENNDS